MALEQPKRKSAAARFVVSVSPKMAPILLCGVVPIFFANLAAYAVGLAQPWIDIDFIAAAVVVSYGGQSLAWQGVSIVAMFLASVALMERFISSLFGFDARHILSASIFVLDWPRALTVGALAVVGVLSLVLVVVARGRPSRRIHPMAGVLLFVAPISADVLAGRNTLFGNDEATAPNIVTSPVYSLLRQAITLTGPAAVPTAWPKRPVSYQALLDATKSKVADTFVLSIGFESLGLPLDAGVRKWLTSAVQNAFVGYNVDPRDEQYHGATLDGELRALCGLKSAGAVSTRDQRVRSVFSQTCIPQLAGEKVQTLAAHGNTGSFYERNAIYPMIGFGRSFFSADFRQMSLGIEWCNFVWDSPCDKSVTRAVLAWASAIQGPIFAHVMSLDTHFPIPVLQGVSEVPDEDPKVRAYYAAVAQSLTGIGREVAGSRRMPNVVVIWGDHAPPWLSPGVRKKFSVDRVPVFILDLRRSQ